MRRYLQQEKTYHQQRRKRRIWHNLIGVLASIVVFCTVYALILPAITLETDEFCAIPSHSHDETCYSNEGDLLCTLEEHSHSEACYVLSDTSVVPESAVGPSELPEVQSSEEQLMEEPVSYAARAASSDPLFFDFAANSPYNTLDGWVGGRTCTNLAIDSTGTGTLSADMEVNSSSGNHYIRSKQDDAHNLNYVISEGDVLRVKMKFDLTAGSFSHFKVHLWLDDGSGNITQYNGCPIVKYTMPDDQYVVVDLYTFTADDAGKILCYFQTGWYASLDACGTFAIDYIYIGPDLGDGMLLDYTPTSQLHTLSDWRFNTLSGSVIDTSGIGTLSGSFPLNTAGTSRYFRSQTSDPYDLGYQIVPGDVMRIRIKLNFAAGTPNRIRASLWITDSGGNKVIRDCASVSLSNYQNDTYIIVDLYEFPPSDAGKTLSHLQVSWTTSEDAYGTYAVDYIYVGPNDSKPVITVDSPTLDTYVSEDIQIDLFDYGTLINYEGAPLYFKGNDGYRVDGHGLPSTGDGDNVIPTMRPTLVNGYPYVDSYIAMDGSTVSGSLQYLFDTSQDYVEGSGDWSNTNTNYKSKHFSVDTSAGTMFRMDENGYLVYDSAYNAAALDTSTNTLKLYAYALRPYTLTSRYSGQGQFLPFHSFPLQAVQVTDSNATPLLPPVQGTSYGVVTTAAQKTVANLYALPAAAAVDDWFGMSVSFDFYQAKDGSYNGSDAVFEFSGDDDVWIYIDERLVLDIGGMHGCKRGTINFATGEVIVYAMDSDTVEYQTTLQERMGLSTTTLADYSRHTIQLFYLERGADCSNCRIMFNLPTLPKSSATVTKRIINPLDELAEDVKYEFSLLDSSYQPVADVSYIITDASDAFIESGTTSAEGKFYLKADQTAILSLASDATYYIRETEADFITSTRSTVNGVAASGTTSSPFTVMPNTTNDIVFTNQWKSPDIGAGFTVEKQVAGQATGEVAEQEYEFLLKERFVSDVSAMSEDILFFDFTDRAYARARYSTELYGMLNFDTGGWGYYRTRSEPPVIQDGTLVLITKGQGEPYMQTSIDNDLFSMPLRYNPKNAEIIELRFKLSSDYALESGTLSPALYYLKNNDDGQAGVNNSDYISFGTISAENLSPDVWYTLQAPVSTKFLAADVINAVRCFFIGLTQGTVTVDYVYVGPDDVPAPGISYLHTAADGTTSTRTTDSNGFFKLKNGETAQFPSLPLHSVWSITESDNPYIETVTHTLGSMTSNSKNAKLTVTDTAQTLLYTNTLSTTNLQISKTVEGITGSTSLAFSFQAEMFDDDGNPVAFAPPTSGTDYTVDTDGIAHFSLSDGQSVTLQKVPHGMTVKITELDHAGYLVSVWQNDVQISGSPTAQIVMKGSTSLEYVNTAGVILPETGGFTNIPYTAGGILILLCAALLLRQKFRREGRGTPSS